MSERTRPICLRRLLRRTTLAAVALGLFWSGSHPIAFAAWPASGLPVCDHAGFQAWARAVEDGSGGAYVAWIDGRSLSQIYIQRITAEGDVYPGWPADGIPVTSTPLDEQSWPAIASDGAGGALVTFTEIDPTYLDTDVYLQRITGSGSVASGWPARGVDVGFAIGDQGRPKVIGDGMGGAIVAWWDHRDPGSFAVYAGRVSHQGLKLWTLGGVAVSDHGEGNCEPPAICTDGQSGVYVTWVLGKTDGTYDLHLQRLDSYGDPATGWPQGGNIPSPSARLQSLPGVVPERSGGVIVVWAEARTEPGLDLYGLRLTETGAIAAGWDPNGVPVCDYVGSDLHSPLVVSDGAGGAIATWVDLRHGSQSVYAQRLSPEGETVWNLSTEGVRLGAANSLNDAQGYQDAHSDGSGGGLFAWMDWRSGKQNIYVQHISDDGRPAIARTAIPVCPTTDSQQYPKIVLTGSQNGIIAFEDDRDLWTTNLDIYAQYLFGLSNLDATYIYPGWDAPAVPRNAPVPPPGDVVHVTPILDGNVENTYMSFGTLQEGPNPMPAWHTTLLVDESWGLGWEGATGDSNQANVFYFLRNLEPTIIRGGRHTLTVYADAPDIVPESDEYDNAWRGQWVWSPLEVEKDIAVVRAVPPDPGFFPEPNCDGMVFTHTPSFAWVTALTPFSLEDDYDLVVYDDYSGSTSGFSSEIMRSALPNGFTDFVVGHRDGTPMTIFPAAVRSDAPVGDPFAMDQTDSDGRVGFESGLFQGVVFYPNEVVDVYEAYLETGTVYYFLLKRLEGTTNLRFGVYPATPGGVWHRGHPDAAPSVQTEPDTDELEYTASSTGWHPIVVCRVNGLGVPDESVTYDFIWDPVGAVDVPRPEPKSYTLAFHGAWPNPMTETSQIRFELAERGPVRLTVFDLRGRRVRALLDETMEAGPHTPAWDGRAEYGRRIGSGIYWLRLEAAGHSFTKRLAVVR